MLYTWKSCQGHDHHDQEEGGGEAAWRDYFFGGRKKFWHFLGAVLSCRAPFRAPCASVFGQTRPARADADCLSDARIFTSSGNSAQFNNKYSVSTEATDLTV